MPPRQIFSAIVYVLRTGCQWKALPGEFGSASAANVHDVKLLAATLDQVVMESPSGEALQNLCADAGYKGVPAWNAVVSRNYQPHIKQCSEEAYLKHSELGYKTRRWVVERPHSWLNRFRKPLVRCEKTEASTLLFYRWPPL